MKLEHPALQPFESILIPLLDTAFTSGINALEAVGKKIEDIKKSESARRRFIRGCHYGYDKAQRRIATLVMDIENKISTSEQELKLLRHNRDPSAMHVLGRLKVLKERELVLRRIVDAILITILRFEIWILRRVIVEDRIRRVDPKVLSDTCRIASHRNSESRYRFSVISDLTTVVQIGDLVEVDLTPGTKNGWKIIELKKGKMNEILSGILEERSAGSFDQVVEEVRSSLGPYAAKQARRILAQEKRMKDFRQIIETDRGMDPGLKVEIHMTPEAIETEDYSEGVRGVVQQTAEKGAAGMTIDGCLHLVGVKGEMIERKGIGVVAHAFLHLASPSYFCKLGEAEENEELEAMRSVPLFIDLVRHSMRAQWGRPVFLWMGISPAHIVDLVMGRIRIFAQFDFESFFRLAAESGIKMNWIVRKEAERFKRLSQRIPGSPDAWGVRVELPDGNSQELLSGFFARVISDLTRPKQLLALVMRTPGQLVKILPEKEQ